MTDDEAKIRTALHFHIIYQIDPGICVDPSPEPPLLGELFALSNGKLFDALSAFRAELVRDLAAIPLEQLRESFTEHGQPKTLDRKTWCNEQRHKFATRFRSMGKWQHALLVPDKSLAKFDYWAKAAFFSLDEVLWLSVGLEPLHEFRTALTKGAQQGNQRDPVIRHLASQRELLRRGLDPNGIERRLTAQKVLSWANLVQHELHPGFRRALEQMVQRGAPPQMAAPAAEGVSDTQANTHNDQQAVATDVQPDTKRLDPRERLAMAKLLVAIAIAEYGYDPDARRSPVPKELTDLVDGLGLGLSRDTILKYLRLGAQHLPKDWKPHE